MVRAKSGEAEWEKRRLDVVHWSHCHNTGTVLTVAYYDARDPVEVVTLTFQNGERPKVFTVAPNKSHLMIEQVLNSWEKQGFTWSQHPDNRPGQRTRRPNAEGK